MSKVTKADLIQAARRASKKRGRPLSRSDFERISGISQYHIYRLFPDGGWSELKKLAGIAKHPRHRERLEDDRILREFHSVASELGRIPTLIHFNSHAQISADVLRRPKGRIGEVQGMARAIRATVPVAGRTW